MAINPALFSKVLRGRSLEEAAHITADLGYDGFEPMCRDPHLGPDRSLDEVRRLRELLDRRGLQVPCLATYSGNYVGKSRSECEEQLDILEKFLDFADALDCDIVRHGAGGPPVRDASDEDFEHAAEWLARAADRAAARDITIAVEIHAHKVMETVNSTRRLLNAVDRENVGAIHDAGNMYIVGTDYGPESVRELGDDLVHVHVKDERRVEDNDLSGAFELETDAGPEVFQPRLLGNGAVNYDSLFDALSETGYDGFVTAECHIPQEAPGDDEEIASHELAALRRLIERTG